MQPLKPSQVKALTGLTSWYNGSLTSAVLHGKAGYGKTFLVDKFIKQLGPRVSPLLLADTNEAVKVLAASTNNQYPTSTVCSALGLVLGHEGHKPVLRQKSSPDLSSYNLLVIDEASQLDEMRLERISELGIRVLYVGHKSQLPPVDENLTSTDKCISPVFLLDYPTYNLLEPVRNVGELATFCDEAEHLICNRGVLHNKYAVPKSFIETYLRLNKSQDDLLHGTASFLAWTNNAVDRHNQNARTAIFGKHAEKEDFIVNDRVIFRSPAAGFANPVDPKLTTLNAIMSNRKNSFEVYTTNTKGTVTFVSETSLLGIPCYELHVQTDHFVAEKSKGIVYVAVDQEELAAYKKKLYFAALYDHNQKSADKKWEQYHALSYVFTNTKHAYARTVHCSQGSTIETVIVDDADIAKCTNPYLRRKLCYVAYSRASLNLYRTGK